MKSRKETNSARGDLRPLGVWTVPNIITIGRMVGTGGLLWLAWAGHTEWFVAFLITLMVTDWLDGKLAVVLDQRTELGARLDSFADVMMYAALLIGTMWLRPEFVRSEAIFIAVMLGSYALSIVVALVRFHRLPAYHTRAAKTGWLLVWIGGFTLLAGGPSWPARAVLIAVTVTNVEAIAISFILPNWQTDVPSIWHALRRTKGG